VHPIKGYGPRQPAALKGDQGVDSDDPVHVSEVANCHGCRIEYDDREPSLGPRIVYCADHDPEELRILLGDAVAAVATLRRALAFIANEADPTRNLAPRIGGALPTIARVARAALRGEPQVQEEPGR
jgi:hypothetical protein